MRVHSPVAAVLAMLVLSTPSAGWQQGTAREAPRQRPPEDFACERNHLTVHTGVVIGYRRLVGSTRLRIRTDWDTTDQITLRHPGTDDPSALFRIGRAPFAPSDWARIEQSKGVVRPSTRAAAWVCTDGKVMVDWGVPKE